MRYVRCIHVTCFLYPKLIVKKVNVFYTCRQYNACKTLLFLDNDVAK